MHSAPDDQDEQHTRPAYRFELRSGTDFSYETGKSRLYAGIHFQFSIDVGFDIGTKIGEATVKAIGQLYSKVHTYAFIGFQGLILPIQLTDRILNNDLLRHLARLQTDTEPAIRTNTCILIGRIAPSMGYNTKRKVLVPAFARALKDGFVHARVAGIMSFMATVDLFDVEDLATKVVPCIAGTLIDKEK